MRSVRAWGVLVRLLALAACATPSVAAPAAGEAPPAPVLRRLINSGYYLGEPLRAHISPLGQEWAGGQTINTYTVTYYSHDWNGEAVRIFGLYGVPAGRRGPVPGVLYVHGASGYATIERVLACGAHGMAGLSIDLPGKGDGRERSRSTGPDMTVRQLFTVLPRLEDNYLYNAALACMRGITFLRTREEVDPDRITMMGVSWGGYTTLLVSSLDERLRAAVDVFGGGFIRERSTWERYISSRPAAQADTWEANFDASRYAGHIRKPILFVTGTNDNCYYLPRFLRTYELVSAKKSLLLRPNLDHKIDDAAHSAIWRWIERRNADPAPGEPVIGTWQSSIGPRSAAITMVGAGEGTVTSASIAFCNDVDGWTVKLWGNVVCQETEGHRWVGTVPLTNTCTYVFGTLVFADGSRVSSPVRTLLRANVGGVLDAYDLPFIAATQIMVPAERFASRFHRTAQDILKRGVKPEAPDAPVPTMYPSALEIDGTLYVSMREAADAIGATVQFENKIAYVYVAPAGQTPQLVQAENPREKPATRVAIGPALLDRLPPPSPADVAETGSAAASSSPTATPPDAAPVAPQEGGP